MAEKYFFIKVGREGKKLLMYKSKDGNPPSDKEVEKAIAVAFINDFFFPGRWGRFIIRLFYRSLFCYEVLDSFRDYPEEFDQDIIHLNNNNDWEEYPYAALCMVFSEEYEEECVRTCGIPRKELTVKSGA